MVKKQNLLIITPQNLNKNKSAGDYRVYCLLKYLHKYFNICLMVINTKTQPKDKTLNKYIKSYIKKTNSTAIFKKFLKQYQIDYCLFERYYNLPFGLYKFIALTKSIIDVHEIGFVKTQELSKIKEINEHTKKIFKAKELLFYQNAKMLICISDKERKILKKFFPSKQIVIVPTPTDIYETNKSFEERKNICYLGSFKHPPNIDAVNYFSKKILPKINKILPETNFYVLGSDSSIFKNKYKNVYIKENIKNISKEMCKYKLFVCPLRYGAGLKKKTLDAMAAKTPIVSTKFGVEGIKRLENKYVSNVLNFVNETVKLYRNKNLWNKQATKNFNIVNKHYSQAKFSNCIFNLSKKIKSI